MSKLPGISGKACIKALQKVGFYQKRRESSHIILRRDEPFAQIVVPDHPVLAKGPLRTIIRDANLSIRRIYRIIVGKRLHRLAIAAGCNLLAPES